MRRITNYNITAYQHRILLVLAKAPVNMKRAAKWDLRPVRALWRRKLISISPDLTIHITDAGLKVLIFQSANPKTKLHVKPVSFNGILYGRLAA